MKTRKGKKKKENIAEEPQEIKEAIKTFSKDEFEKEVLGKEGVKEIRKVKTKIKSKEAEIIIGAIKKLEENQDEPVEAMEPKLVESVELEKVEKEEEPEKTKVVEEKPISKEITASEILPESEPSKVIELPEPIPVPANLPKPEIVKSTVSKKPLGKRTKGLIIRLILVLILLLVCILLPTIGRSVIREIISIFWSQGNQITQEETVKPKPAIPSSTLSKGRETTVAGVLYIGTLEPHPTNYPWNFGVAVIQARDMFLDSFDRVVVLFRITNTGTKDFDVSRLMLIEKSKISSSTDALEGRHLPISDIKKIPPGKTMDVECRYQISEIDQINGVLPSLFILELGKYQKDLVLFWVGEIKYK